MPKITRPLPAARFQQRASGACYFWDGKTKLPRGAYEVDGHTAADYYRSIGVENAITEAFPASESAPARSTRAKGKAKAKAEPAEPEGGFEVGEPSPDELYGVEVDLDGLRV